MRLVTNMKFVLPILVILTSIFSASAATVTVNKGESIQDAVNHAASGDIILVQSGVYNEQVIIGKPLNIIGETERGATIIKGGVILNADGITIQGLRITGADVGILVKLNNNVIKNNIVIGNALGIRLLGNTNKVFNNYFDNSQNAQDSGGNQWNGEKTDGVNIIGGIYLGGNFWSDYSGTDADSDGIGDNSYIAGSVIDALPLVKVAAIPPQSNVTLPPVKEVKLPMSSSIENNVIGPVPPPFGKPVRPKVPGAAELPSLYIIRPTSRNISQPYPVDTPVKIEGSAPVPVSQGESALLEQLKAARLAGDMGEVQDIEGKLATLHGGSLSYVQSNAVSNGGPGTIKGGPAPASEAGVKWALNDILVAGDTVSETGPKITHDKEGNLYVALQRYADNTTRIYKSEDNGSSWYWWYWFCGPDCGTPQYQASLATGEGGSTNNNFLMLAVNAGYNYIGIFRVNLTDLTWDERNIEYNPGRVSSPAIVTDNSEYSYWYGYLVYNSYNGTGYDLKFSRSTDFGGNWSGTVLHSSPNSYDRPAIDYGNGNLYVVYDDYTASTSYDVYGRTSNNFGSSWNPQVQITAGSDSEFQPSVAAAKNDAGNKTAVVAYTLYSSLNGYDAQFAYTWNGGTGWSYGWCLACTSDYYEMYPAVTASDSRGSFHAAYFHNGNLDYKSASYIYPWYLAFSSGIQGISSVPTVAYFVEPTISTNPRKSIKDEAAIAWQDDRNYATTLNDIYFNAPALPGKGECYDFTTSSVITPPQFGNWYIYDNIECNSITITMNGSVQIYGQLSLNNVYLRMNPTYNGQYSIDTYNGSTFHISDLSGMPSTITNGDVSNAYYTFRVNKGTDFKLLGSNVFNAGFAYNLDTAGNNYNDAGLWINANNTVIDRSNIGYNHFMGVILYNSNGNNITNSSIYSNDWDGIYAVNSNNNHFDYNGYIWFNGQNGISITGNNNTFFNNYAFAYNGYDGVSVSGSNNKFLNNTYVYSNGQDGIALSGSNCIISNNGVYYNSRGIVLSSSTGCLIQNNYVYGNSFRGIDLESSPNNLLNLNTATYTSGQPDASGIILVYSQNNTLTNNTATYNTYGIRPWNSPMTTVNNNTANSNGAGISLENSDNSTVDNNLALYNSGGIGLSGTDFTLIRNNNASNNGNGISLSGSTYDFIFNNTAQSNNFGISMTYSSYNNVTQNKNVERNNNYGIYLFNSHYNNITRNNMNNSGSIGVHLEGSNYNNVLWNYAQKSGNYGFDLFNSNSNNVSMNDAKASHDIGVGLSSSNINIVTNNIVQNNSIGISMRWSNNNDVESNTALSDNFGIYMFQSGGNAVIANTASNGYNVGIENSVSNSNIIHDNTVNGNGNYGIHAYASTGVDMRNNTALSNGVGVFLDWSPSNQIIQNTVGMSKLGGIALLFSSNNNNVSRNTANSNGNISIKVSQSTGNIIQSNTVKSSDIGIFMDWSKNNMIQGNTAYGNNFHGITLEWFSDNNNIMNNNASGNIVGLSLSWSSNNDIENNTINRNNVSTNIEWSSNNNILRNNTMSSNSYAGMSMSWFNTNNTITGNRIDTNGRIGIYSVASSGNTIYNNYIANPDNAHDNGVNTWNITKTAGTNIIGGSFLGGNYWNDYMGVDIDSDGLGDTMLPYNSGGNISSGGDMRPLVSTASGSMSVSPTTWNVLVIAGSSKSQDFTVSASGGNVHGVNVTKITGPSWLNIAPGSLGDILLGSPETFTATASPGLGDTGTYPLMIQVRDSGGNTSNVVGNITVNIGPLVYVVPSSQTANRSTFFIVNITVDPKGTPIYGGQFNLTFDTTRLEVISLTQGGFLRQDGASTIVIVNSSDNTNGVVMYGEVRVGTPNGVNNTGTLASIMFHVKGTAPGGDTTLHLKDVVLSDTTPAPIPNIGVNDGKVTILAGLPPVAICGPDKLSCENVGTAVQFNGSASYDLDDAIVSFAWQFGDSTTGTGATPKHTFTTYKWNGIAYQPFIVNLTVTDNSGLTNTTSQKVVIWIAGDANGDGKVNILDAAVIGLKWSTNDQCADLNNDGTVNIIDAAIIGLNWGKTA